MNTDKRLVVAALIGGFIVGLLVGLAGGDRYQLKDSGIKGVVYKLDTRTGQTWMENGADEIPVRQQGGSQ